MGVVVGNVYNPAPAGRAENNAASAERAEISAAAPAERAQAGSHTSESDEDIEGNDEDSVESEVRNIFNSDDNTDSSDDDNSKNGEGKEDYDRAAMKRKDNGQETSKKQAKRRKTKAVPGPFKSAEDDSDLLPY